MLERVFAELGPWNWMVLGFVLLALEILVPGVFLLWIGLAAIVTGAITLFLWDMAWWGWEVQVIVFLALALAAAFLGHRITRSREEATDEPLLNRRDAQLVGRTALLEEPIHEGFGRIRIDDTLWRVKGPDAAPGTRVRVVSAGGGDLVVEVI
ncbi:MAG: NfeD family protein [Mesorhizobium sp.]|nr:NfeD family protein [Mesorhizobium sp.]